MLETSYTLSLGQLLVIAPDLKRYLWQKLKLEKIQNSSKATTDKQVGSSITKVGTVVIALNNHMALIQIHIGKNAIEDVLLDGNYGINIITTHLRLKLGLWKPKPTPYNLRMADQITTKPLGLIKELKMYVHGIPYITTFTILQNSVVDFNYSMLLGRPWLKDVKVAHD